MARDALAVIHRELAPPAAVGRLALQQPLEDDLGRVEVEAVVGGVVHRHGEDEMPARLAAVAEVVVAREPGDVTVGGQLRGIEGAAVAGEEVVVEVAFDEGVVHGEVALGRAGGEAAGRSATGGPLAVIGTRVADGVGVHRADERLVGVVMNGVHVAVVPLHLLGGAERAQVARAGEVEQEGVLGVVLAVAPVDDALAPPVAEVEHAVFAVGLAVLEVTLEAAGEGRVVLRHHAAGLRQRHLTEGLAGGVPLRGRHCERKARRQILPEAEPKLVRLADALPELVDTFLHVVIEPMVIDRAPRRCVLVCAERRADANFDALARHNQVLGIVLAKITNGQCDLVKARNRVRTANAGVRVLSHLYRPAAVPCQRQPQREALDGGEVVRAVVVDESVLDAQVAAAGVSVDADEVREELAAIGGAVLAADADYGAERAVLLDGHFIGWSEARVHRAVGSGEIEGAR